MLSFISKRKPKSHKPWKKPIRLVSEPEDYTQSFSSQRSIDILDIVDLEKSSPYREPVPLDAAEPTDVEAGRSSEGDDNVPAREPLDTSPRVDVTITEDPEDDWFPRHLMDADSGDHSAKRDRRESRMLLDNEHSGLSSVKDRRPPPAPIKIPNATFHAPKVHLQRASGHGAYGDRPESAVSLQDNLSTISGTTLARVLLGSSFIFPGEHPGDASRRSSRYRSGMTTLTRQDSATLPRSDDPLIYSPWHDMGRSDIFDSIPPVPPVPSEAELLVLASRADERRSQNKMAVPEVVGSATSLKVPEQAVPDTSTTSENEIDSKSYSSRSIPSRPFSASPGDKSFHSIPRSVPTTASLYPSTPEFSPPASSAASSGHELDNVLDYYQFSSSWELPSSHPGRPAFSPIMEETRSELSSARTSPRSNKPRPAQASSSSPLTPGSARVDAGFGQSRTRRTLLPIGDSPRSPSFFPVIFKPSGSSRASGAPQRSSSSVSDGESSRTTTDQLSVYSASSGGSHLDPPPGRHFIPGPGRSGSTPSPITVVRDPNDARRFNISISPNEGILSDPGSASMGDSTGTAQTFPETPRAFSPLWSPAPGGDAASLASAMSGIAASINSTDMRIEPSLSSRHKPSNSVASQLKSLPEDASPPASAPSSHNDLSPSSVYFASTPGSSSSSREQGSSTIDPEAQKSVLPSREQGLKPLDVETLATLVSDTEASPPVSPTSMPAPQPQQTTVPRPDTVASNSSSQSTEHETQSVIPAASRSSLMKARLPSVDGTTPASSSTTSLPQQINTSSSIPANAGPALDDRSMSYFPPVAAPEAAEMQDSGTYYSAPPPSYDTVVAAAQDVPLPPSHVSTPSDHPCPPRNAEETAGRRLTRSRPPLPAGPRRPSAGMVPMGSRTRLGSEPNIATRARNGSIGSVSSSQRAPQFTSTLRFRAPEPKWKGLTIDAAKWTFTSSELQGLVSQSIRQSAESSSIRLLHPNVINNELPTDLSHLQTERNDLTTRYKVLTRKRNALLGNLSLQAEQRDEVHDTNGNLSRTVEELGTACSTLDNLADDLLTNAESITQLTSLRDVHSYSALAMALRKLNASFVKQVADNQKLRDRINALEAEKEEAWKQAESVANDFDALAVQVPEEVLPESAKSIPLSRRVSRRKSRCGAEMQLRSSSGMRNKRLSSSSANALSSARSTFSGDVIIPPVPPIPRPRGGARLGINTDHSFMRESTVTQSDLSTQENSAMYRAQQELYDMLGIPTGRPKRHHSFSGGRDTPSVPPTPGEDSESTVFVRPKRPSSLPGSASLSDLYDSATADQHAILKTLGMISSTDQ